MDNELKTPIPFPTPKELGYTGTRKIVAFWWEPGGDELAIYDGHILTVGMGNNWAYLDWLRAVGYPELDMGDSDNAAKNCILVNTETNTVLLAPLQEAQRQLRDLFMQEQREIYIDKKNVDLIVNVFVKLKGD